MLTSATAQTLFCKRPHGLHAMQCAEITRVGSWWEQACCGVAAGWQIFATPSLFPHWRTLLFFLLTETQPEPICLSKAAGYLQAIRLSNKPAFRHMKVSCHGTISFSGRMCWPICGPKISQQLQDGLKCFHDAENANDDRLPWQQNKTSC